jgi:hypothetical protein
MPQFSNVELNSMRMTLATGTAESRLKLLSTVAVTPPNTATGAPALTGDANTDWTKLKVLPAGNRVAYLDLMVSNDVAKKGAVTFDATMANDTAVGARATKPACWWLPWQSRHIVKLQIDALGGALQDSAGQAFANPGLFFTAAVSGCSVFARGNVQHPSVYHAGIDGKLFDAANVKGVFNKTAIKSGNLGGSSAEFWRRAMGGMNVGPGGTAWSGQYKGNLAEVNLTHYVNDKATGTTINASGLEKFLKKNKKLYGIDVLAVSPWGCVFGLRFGTVWHFFLQQNATVIYTKAGAPKQDAIVLRCTEFFPGVGQAQPPKLATADFDAITRLLG